MKWYESPVIAILILAMGYMAVAAAFLIYAIKHAIQQHSGPAPKQRAILLVEKGVNACEHGTSFRYSCPECDDADMVEETLEELFRNPPFTTYN